MGINRGGKNEEGKDEVEDWQGGESISQVVKIKWRMVWSLTLMGGDLTWNCGVRDNSRNKWFDKNQKCEEKIIVLSGDSTKFSEKVRKARLSEKNSSLRG